MKPPVTADVQSIVTLTRDRDAWQALALQTLAILQDLQILAIDNWPGEHRRQMHDIEKKLIAKALLKHDGNKQQTARFLGVARPTINNQLFKERVKTGRRASTANREEAGLRAGGNSPN